MGYISRWSDPAISADNDGIVLPDQAINVVYRAGQSGTTALFYDFVQKTDPGEFAAVGGPQPAARPNVRILSLDQSPGFAPKTQAFNGSDQIAQYIASEHGHVEHRLRRVLASPSTTRPRPPGSRTPRVPTSCPYAAEHLRGARERQASARPQPGAVGRLQQREPRGLPDLGLQLHRDPVRGRGRPADVQGQLRQPRGLGDPLEVAALHRVRGPDPDGEHRLLAPAAATSRRRSPTPSAA